MQPYLRIPPLVSHCVLNGIALFVLFFLPANQLYAASCESVARLVSLEGSIEYKTVNTENWNLAELEQEFCNGDAIRSGRDSRAALRLINDTLLRLDHSTAIIFTSITQKERSLLDLLKGALHFISRVPRSLDVNTPYLNAAIEGTEFVIKVKQDRAEVTVYEGKVVASNASGSIDLISNQTGAAASGQAPIRIAVARPRDAVAWTLYYPPLPAQQDQADMLAHQAIDAIVRNDIEQAASLAQQAIANNPQSAAAYMAQSYVEQARFDIPAALENSRRAADLKPQDAITQARLAEVLLMTGDTEAARAVAENAVQIAPSLAHTQTVLGFSSLRDVNLDDAESAFNQAVRLDSAAPLPRLGLGLVKIRRGNLKAGREEIETAVLLDPNNALLRSYMGKAYFEEKRDDLADSQINFAKDLDPLDPTPWLYDAIRKQTINQPIAALDYLQKSIERNSNRAIYRSNLRLDQDMAARSASLGRIYRDLGFEQRALVEGWKSTNADPSDFSGHRLLADTYSVLPRHEVARVSELLQSQLLQPINISPIQPQLAETNLFVLSGAGPSSIGFNEFNPLFASDGLRLQTNAVTGDDDSDGYDIVLSGVTGRYSFSLGQFGYKTDGIRENNGQDRDLYNIFAQVKLSSKTDFQVEYRKAESDVGDLRILFDADNFSPNANTQEVFKLGRIGMHHEFEVGSDFIANVSYVDEGFDYEDTTFDPVFGLGIDSELGFKDRGWSAEIQHIYRRDQWRLISGFGAFETDRKESSFILTTAPNPPFSFVTADETSESEASLENIYVYVLVDQSDQITWTLGLSYDDYEEDAFDRHQTNPKIGIYWSITNNTTMRASAFRTLTRPLVASQTIEPTQVAGFNQFFDGVEGEETRRYGVAIDHRFSSRLYSGIEYSMRELKVPIEFPSSVEIYDWDENFARAYLHWAFTERFALGVDYLFEDFARENHGGEERIFELTTHSLPVTVSYFNPSGWTSRITTTFIDQEGEFDRSVPFSDSDEFAVVDLDISYRLPKRYGVVSLSVKNLFDEEFQFQDTDPSNPRVLSDKLVLLKVSLSL